MPSWLASLTENAAWLGAGVVVLAALALGYQVGQWAAPEPTIQMRTDTVTVAEPMAPGDILEATTPSTVTEHDTSETRTECIQVPTWLTHSPSQLPNSRKQKSQKDAERRSLRATGLDSTMAGRAAMSPRLVGPPYAITPLMSGSPSLSVESEQVQLQGFLPTGEGRQWTYDIPQDHWHLWPSVGAETTPVGLQASASVNLRWQKVTVSAGYMQAADSRGLTFGVRLRPFTISW